MHFQPAGGTDLDAAPTNTWACGRGRLPTSASTRRRWTRLRADLESRQAFQSAPDAPHRTRGRPRIISYSGRPRFSANGRSAASGASGATSLPRCRRKTPCSPARRVIANSSSARRRRWCCTGGRVLDANPAAATMCGFADPADMTGFDLPSMYRGESSRARTGALGRTRIRSTPAKGLPVADFVLQAPSSQGCRCRPPPCA